MKQIIILFFLLPLLAASQTIKGAYTHRKGLETHRISLKDSTFIKSYGHAFAHGGSLSKGYFKIKNDTLLLQFQSWKNKSSYFEIITQKKINKKYTSLGISVYDMKDSIIENLPIMYSLKSKDSNLANITQIKSNYIEFWKADSTITEIIINSFGYRRVSIPLQKFSGWSAELKVKLLLDDQNIYHNFDLRKEKYYWNKKTKTLQFINDKQELTLTYRKEKNKR